MSAQEIDSATSSETDGDEASELLDKLNKVQELVDAMVVVPTVEKRRETAKALHEFLNDWRNEIKFAETARHESPKADGQPFWSRLFGVGGSRKSVLATSMLEDVSDPTISESVSSSQCSAVPATMSNSVYTESSVRDAPTAVEPSALVEESEKTGPPSLHLMTCQSADCDSLATKPTAIGNIESSAAFKSYLLQTVDDSRPVGELKTRVNGLDTSYSAAAVSSCVVEEAPATQFEDRVLSDQEMFQKAIHDQILAMIGGDEDGEGGLGVEILEVAPANEDDIANPVKLADNSERSEVESLRSSQPGLVRKMIDAFNRFTS